MSWDSVWEEVYRTREWGRYPPEELIRFVARNYFRAPDRSQVKILEIGCGIGANLWFLGREGFDAYGIDGSSTAIAKAEQRLNTERLLGNLRVGDALKLSEFYPQSYFDAIIDVGCLTCNRLESTHAILAQSLAVLKSGGRIFSMIFATGTWGDGLGTEIEPGTFADITAGPLYGLGINHFFSLGEVQQAFKTFSNQKVEYVIRSMDDQQHIVKLWVVEGIKSE